MDESVQKNLEAQTGTLRLSEVVRECGYSNPGDPIHCVVGRAFTKVTGNGWLVPRWHERFNVASAALKVPVPILVEAEKRCYARESPEQIADWLAAQGY